MTYQVKWEDESKRILHQIYTDTVTVEDYYQAVKETSQRIAEVPHTVDIIMNVLDGKVDLKGFITASQYANRMVAPNQRLVIGVGINGMVRAMVGVVKNFAPKATEKVHFVDTLEEAYQLIHAYQDDIESKDDLKNTRR